MLGRPVRVSNDGSQRCCGVRRDNPLCVTNSENNDRLNEEDTSENKTGIGRQVVEMSYRERSSEA